MISTTPVPLNYLGVLLPRYEDGSDWLAFILCNDNAGNYSFRLSMPERLVVRLSDDDDKGFALASHFISEPLTIAIPHDAGAERDQH